MAWITPKTNWVATDYFNIEDYNRIKSNLIYLNSLIEVFFEPITIEDMGADKTYTSLVYAEDFNKFERNLKAINDGSFKLDIGSSKNFTPNGNTPDYLELNRIESMSLEIMTYFMTYLSTVAKLPFGINKEYLKAMPRHLS